MSVADGRIVQTGQITASNPAPGGSVKDLGDVAILPALVNAHTHLEFSDLPGPIGRPGMELAEWIVEVVHARQNATLDDDTDRPSPRANITQGALEAQRGGTGLIGEIASTPWPGIDPHTAELASTKIISFAEVLGLTQTRANEKFHACVSHLESHRSLAGISPHAPYSTPLSLIDRCLDLAIRTNHPVAMHVAESPAERELLQQGSGPFADNLASLGFDLSALFPWRHPEPIRHLIERLAVAPSALLVHGNDLRPLEIGLIAEHPTLNVVYCPRTHAFFAHDRHPVAELMAAGVNVALGTDSRASNPDLQLWREVRWLLQHRQDLSPADVLKMATLGGARALRQDDRYGTLAPGRASVFAIVPTTAPTAESLYVDFADFDASSADALHN
ncbi:amidohydrolase family protein [Aporhodopirellula aestuarii]|uniref:Amidohydrolase family protein n=1 Tax=Aporhodopirellula aestuarii TaxID=2950107 RepID=A0ABT0U542_9BACT|nr:amidohydrolase family protein [Aporhodopirellula aestuarii]MCM2371680.1 amidohydrolase family protein [Aporhodopirellula aestuarii]